MTVDSRGMPDKLNLLTTATVFKFTPVQVQGVALELGVPTDSLDGDTLKRHATPQIEVVNGNTVYDLGVKNIWNALIGVGITAYSSANALLQVGNGSGGFTASLASSVGVTGSSTAQVGMDATYPLLESNTLVTWQGTFGAATANFAWGEWAVSNGTQALNRRAASFGTKTAGNTWILQVSLGPVS